MTNFFRAGRPRRQAALLSCSRGATAIEYGLIMALLTLAIIGSITLVANKTTNMWGNVANAVKNS